jgi:hypothetical protein
MRSWEKEERMSRVYSAPMGHGGYLRYGYVFDNGGKAGQFLRCRVG